MTLSEIYNRVKRGKLTHILPALLTADITWTGTEDEKTLAKIFAECSEPFLTLTRTAIAAVYLNSPENCPLSTVAAIQKLIQLKQCGFNLSWADALQITWRTIDVPLVGKNEPELNTFLLGHKSTTNCSCISYTVSKSLSRESLDAVNVAIRLSGSRYPGAHYCMRVIGPNLFPVSGKSMALPIYIAFEAAAKDNSLPKIALTGDIDVRGNVLPVNDLEKKAEKIFENGYEGLVCPRQKTLEDPHAYAVRTVDEASLLCSQLSPQIYSELKHFLHHLTDPGKTAQELADLSTDCLYILQNQHLAKIQTILSEAIKTSPGDVRSMLKKIESCLERPNWSMRRMKNFILLLPREDEIGQLIDTNPDIAFRIYYIKYILKNHCGELETDNSHPDLVAKMLDAALRINNADFDGVKRNIRYIAGSLVRKRHNAFIFSPDILPLLPRKQKKMLEYAEEEYFKRKAVFMQPNPDLGAFWGTLTQNYAFCGPDFMDKTKEYAWKAWEAFGADNSNKDCKRCISYLYFACLDAGLIEEAGTYLERLTPGNSLDSLSSKKSLKKDPFLALALARWLDETGSQMPNQFKTLKEVAASSEVRHPWQLVVYNIARIEPDPQVARAVAKQSLEFCMQKEAEPPIKAMGLLPLSLLHARKQISPTKTNDSCQRIMSIIDKHLNTTGHFNRLLNKPCEKIMESIEINRQELFPFTYR